MMELLIKKKGIPLAIYSDKHTIFKSPEGNITSFGVMMECHWKLPEFFAA